MIKYYGREGPVYAANRRFVNRELSKRYEKYKQVQDQGGMPEVSDIFEG